MKFTYSWLKDFVDVKLPAEKLADKLTMAGLEVKSQEFAGGDFVFEIEITSNRPDWLSVAGVAREVAAITNTKLKSQIINHKPQRIKNKSGLKIEIEDKKDCPLYTAKIIKNVSVGPSPDWLKNRLELIGCRSINNVVDITNYIMFTYGEPMHAFDLDKLNTSKIIVRRAKKGEKILSIDAQERDLDQEILVIAGQERPVAIAGIMGGIDTEVDSSTKNILLEAAIFNLIVVRQGKRKLGMQSESAYRFERGIDFATAESSSAEAVRLIEDLSGGKCVEIAQDSAARPKQAKVRLDLHEAGRALGINITASQAKDILTHLGFAVSFKSKAELLVTVPLFRQDVKTSIDLVEELARIYGFENMPTTLPAVKPQVGGFTDTDKIALTKSILTGLGLSEIISYSLISRDMLKGMAQDNLVGIRNPLSQEQEVLRPTMLPGLLKAVAGNLNQKQSPINIFEIAKVFSRGQSDPKEDLALSIGLCGTKAWLFSQGQLKDEPDLLHIKGILTTLFQRLGIKDHKFCLTSGGFIEIYLGQDKIGRFFKVKKDILDNFDIKNKDVFAAELSLGEVLRRADFKKKLSVMAAYPTISRDISIVIKKDVSADTLLADITRNSSGLLKEVRIIDYYQGKQIPAGWRGLTLSCVYRSEEKTLTEEEVNIPHSQILDVLKNNFQAQLR